MAEHTPGQAAIDAAARAREQGGLVALPTEDG